MAKKPYLGLDLGGTSMRAGVVAADGTVLALEKRKTKPELGAEGVVARMAVAVERALEAAGLRARDVGGLGIGVPGPVDEAHRVVRLAVNLGRDWNTLPLAELMEDAVGVSTIVDNDVRVGALGEHTHGAGQGLSDLVAIFVGTGVGGGLILDGKLRTGWRASAGEVGHTVVDGNNGVIGKTGQPGTVEPLAARSGMEAQIAARVAQGQASVVPELILSVGQGRLTSRVIYEALRRNDAVMQEVLAVSQRALGLLTGNLINILDPQMVIFGGGVTERLGNKFVAPIRRVAYANLLNKQNARLIRIVPAALKDASGVVGAAVLARQKIG